MNVCRQRNPHRSAGPDVALSRSRTNAGSSAGSSGDKASTALLISAKLGLHPSLHEDKARSALTRHRTIAKIRARLLPFLFVLYVVAFLDRINIGFAALTMNKDLAISSQQFGLLVGIFFFGYFLFEVPSNLILHRVGARVWIARILISWGAVAMATGFVRNVPQLYGARFLLGIAEAGFFPGIVLYLTYWFPPREQARAIALFMAAQPITSILGAPLSGFILDQSIGLGLASWRWLLILEAVPAFLLGLLTYLYLPSRPAEATFPHPAEKDQLARRSRKGKVGAREASTGPARA